MNSMWTLATMVGSSVAQLTQGTLVAQLGLGTFASLEQFEGKAALQELHRNPHVRRCRVCRVGRGVYEVALVVVEPRRSRAVAMRVERLGRGWSVTQLEVG